MNVYRQWLNIYTRNKRRYWELPEPYERMLDTILTSTENIPNLWCWLNTDGNMYHQWEWVSLN